LTFNSGHPWHYRALSGIARAISRQWRMLNPAAKTGGLTGLKVAVYGNWDFESAIRDLIPGGAWGPVHFAPGAAVSDPDFVLILNTPAEPHLDLTMPPERIWFAVGEPPDFHAYHLGQGKRTVVLTCDEALAADPPPERSFILTHPVLRTWHVKRSIDQLANMGPIAKPKTLSWVTSNKEYLVGHEIRMRFLRQIRDQIPFDLYGRGFRPIDDKWDAIAPYRYSIAFENSLARPCFTEKLMDCFVCLTFPIYYGTSDIQRYFPSRSLITFDPEDPLVADRIKDIIASDLWRERQDALEEAKWLVLYKYNMFSQLSRLMLDRVAPPTARAAVQIVRHKSKLHKRPSTSG
jgi:Glycosyltransferase family 10 (fucosyltransferase) C-term